MQTTSHVWLLAVASVAASCAASSCIFLVDEAEDGATSTSSTSTGGGAAGAGGEGGSGGAGQGGAAACAPSVTLMGAPLTVEELDVDSQLVLNAEEVTDGSSSAFVYLDDGTIRRFQIVPGNSAPIQPWFDAPSPYGGARIAPAAGDKVLVTQAGRVFRLAAVEGQLMPDVPDVWPPGGSPSPPQEAVEVGTSVFVRAGTDVFRVGQPTRISGDVLVNRLTANDRGAHWIFNRNAVASCLDSNCPTQTQSSFFESPVPFPVFAVRSQPPQTIYLRTGGGADPAFVGTVGTDLTSIEPADSALATARSAAFLGEHLVVVTDTGEVRACCVDGVPSCGPALVGGPATHVAASPEGSRAVLAIGGALQLITVND
jgi:hypothetical protein